MVISHFVCSHDYTHMHVQKVSTFQKNQPIHYENVEGQQRCKNIPDI